MIEHSRLNAPLYFIRHGETDWNIERRFQGQSDIPLNESGADQAVMNAAILSGLLENPIEADHKPHFVTSPLSRAAKSMQLVLDRLALKDSSYQTNDALKEISFGLWEGLTPAQAKQRYYQERQRRRLDRWTIAPPGGESFAERVGNIKQFLADLPPHSVIVSHSGIMRIIIHVLTGLAPQEAVKIEIPHIGVHIWDGKHLIFAENCP